MNSLKPLSILICRLSHIGDCLLTLPLAVRLREAFPQAKIVWVSEASAAELLRWHPALDEVLVVKRQWFHDWRQWRQVRQTLRPYKFDLAFDPQGLIKSSLAAWLSGATKRWGFVGKHGREFSPWLNNRLVTPRSAHLVDRTLELLASLRRERPVAASELYLPIPADSQPRINEWLLTRIGQPYFVINPGASWPSKQWCNERFGAAARWGWETFALKPLVTWGGAAESQAADEIVAASQGVAVKAPATSLSELGVACQKARFFLGCDTGPLHLANASGTPCIGLYGPTLPTESGAYGAQHLAIQKRHHSGSRRERRNADNSAMLQIQLADVQAAMLEMSRRWGASEKDSRRHVA